MPYLIVFKEARDICAKRALEAVYQPTRTLPIKKTPIRVFLFIGRRLRIRTADPLGVNEVL